MKVSRERLAAMSREEKLKYLDLIEEKKRRAREQRVVFKPNEGQLPVLMSRKILRAVFAGNGGGKTALGINIAKAAVEGFDPWLNEHTPVPCRVYVVLDRPEKVEQTWLPELKKWMNLKPEQLHKKGKPYFSEIVFDNGSYIRFLFHDMEPMSFESLEGDVFIFDEPPPRHVFIGLKRAGRTKGRQAKYIIIGTPLAAPWLRTEVFEPWARGESPDTDCFKYGTAVNKQNLAEGYIEQFSAVLSEKEKSIRLEGNFFDLDGLALAHLFDRTKHLLPRTKPWDKSNPCVVAIDPHPNKKHVALLVGADENGPVVLKELALKATPREYAQELKKWYQGHRLMDIICDSLGSADMTGGEGFKSFIQVLREEGVLARATSYEDKSDEDWIQRIQDVLLIPSEPNNFGQYIPKLRLMESAIGTIGDIETVQWVKYRNLDEYKPKLDISNKDYLACLKYALATNIHHKRTEKVRPYYRTDRPHGLALRRDKILVTKRQAKAVGARPRSFHDDDDD